jgi:hypothetical protein
MCDTVISTNFWRVVPESCGSVFLAQMPGCGIVSILKNAQRVMTDDRSHKMCFPVLRFVFVLAKKPKPTKQKN